VLKIPPIANTRHVTGHAKRRHNQHKTNSKTTDKMPTLRKIKRAAMQPHKPTQIAAHLILPNRTQSPPTTRQVDKGQSATEQ